MQTEWLEKDYYAVLGVPETADEKEVRRAYRRLARQLHPDAHPDDAEAEERFKAVAAAYDVLGDQAKRAEYDRVRRLGPAAAAGPAGTGGFAFRVDDAGGFGAFDLGDLLGDLLASGRRGPRRGADLETELRLSFEEAARGTTAEVAIGGPGPVRVRIPAGVDDGQLVRVPGRGGAAPAAGEPGDLFVRVAVAPHPLFGRSGRDLTVTLPVTYPEAVLGADVEVPTLDGPPVTVRIPPGTPSGRTLRVRGRGLPRGKGSGDLLVTVEVAVPARVDAEERRAVAALAAVTGDPRAHLRVAAAA